MANILKDGKTYTDDRGVVYGNPYMVINNTTATSTPIQTFQFSVEIYTSSEAKASGYKPVLSWLLSMTTDDIATYLIAPKTASSTESPLGFARKAVYTYLGTVEPAILGIIWSDWKSDQIGGVPN